MSRELLQSELDRIKTKIAKYEKTNTDGSGVRLNSSDSAHYTQLRMDAININMKLIIGAQQ